MDPLPFRGATTHFLPSAGTAIRQATFLRIDHHDRAVPVSFHPELGTKMREPPDQRAAGKAGCLCDECVWLDARDRDRYFDEDDFAIALEPERRKDQLTVVVARESDLLQLGLGANRIEALFG